MEVCIWMCQSLALLTIYQSEWKKNVEWALSQPHWENPRGLARQEPEQTASCRNRLARVPPQPLKRFWLVTALLYWHLPLKSQNIRKEWPTGLAKVNKRHLWIHWGRQRGDPASELHSRTQHWHHQGLTWYEIPQTGKPEESVWY